MAGEPDGLQIFRDAYPDVSFNSLYDSQKADWLIVIKIPETVNSKNYKEYEFYWAGGRFLPEKELFKATSYWPLLYLYPKELKDPKDFSDEEVKNMRNIGSKDSRNNTAGTPMFLFDALYNSFNEESLKPHLVGVMFLGRWMKIHERLVQPLDKVDKKVKALAKTDKEVAQFLKEIGTLDSYYWREIRDVNRKSFHSLGIALDVMPKNLHGKAVYWSWVKDFNPDNWMLTPLKSRWMPPDSVVKIFEEEGFIWGGKWAIWDNMHFEYHPELLIFSNF